METGFNDPIADRKGKKMNSPWNFNCPPYDERTSCYVNAGGHHGVGYKNPVGHSGKAKSEVPTLPKGRVNTLSVSGIPISNLPLEIQE